MEADRNMLTRLVAAALMHLHLKRCPNCDTDLDINDYVDEEDIRNWLDDYLPEAEDDYFPTGGDKLPPTDA